MKAWQKSIVYRSKDEADWTEAKRLLSEAGIEQYPFAAEESPISGCGVKVDPRRFLNPNPVPSMIYRIEVAKADKDRAEEVLLGKVRPVLSYGYSL